MNLPYVAGKYALLRKIASGGMAEVFLAKQVGFDGFEKLVVLKRILPHLAHQREYVRMFLEEAKTAADLRHSNVVSTFEIGEDHGIYFMVMEFLHGQDVRTIFRTAIASKIELPLQHAVGIVIDACSGLQYAHTKRDLKGRSLAIVHRDISPQNIVVTYEGETKIVDFGIAKTAQQADETASGVLKGKYSYMSPEQAMGYSADHRTDVFALGIVLYEMTMLRRLFKKESEAKTLRAIIDCQVAPPSTIVEGYPKDLEAIVMRALAKDKQLRFDSCGELRAELEAFLMNQHLVHSPSRLGQFMRMLFCERIEKERALGAVEDIDGLSALFWTGSYGDSSHSDFAEVSEKKKEPSIADAHKKQASNPIDTISTRIEVPQRRPYLLILLSIGVACLGAVLAATVMIFWVNQPSRKAEPIASNLITLADVPSERETTQTAVPAVIDSQESVKKIVEKPPKKALGRLKVVVQPWAEVYLNGVKIGSTPLAAQKLPEGRYQVRLENPKLGKKISREIFIDSGKDTLLRHVW